jgi:hypothetical protein
MDEEQDADQVAQQALEEMILKFSMADQDNVGPMEQLQLAYGYGDAGFSAHNALAIYEEACSEAAQLSSWAAETADPDNISKASLLLHAIQESYSALVAVTRWKLDADRLSMSDADRILRFVKSDGDKELPVQVVVKFILQHTNRMQLRHRDDNVFVQQFTEQNLPTHAWVTAKDVGGHDLSTLEKMTAFICTKSHNADVWTTWLATNTKSVVDKLRICIEPEFKILKTTRAWLAFTDGLYNVYTDTFVGYQDTKRFGIPPTMAACAYHKVAFEPAFSRVLGQPGIPLHPYLEVQTPLFDKILSTQKLCGHTCFWLAVMVSADLLCYCCCTTAIDSCPLIATHSLFVSAQIGRCLYFSNVLESWQVCPMLKGKAGTGKSTLVQFTSRIYEPSDSVIISNDAQATFGLQSLTPDIYLWCVPELKTDFNVDQAQFQSLVSQERMSIGRKYIGAFDGVIRAHGIMAGNTLPLRWQDNAGSIRRRLFIIEFDKKPPKSDGNLLERLCTVELPYVLRKVNWCYRHACVLLNGRDLWQSGCLSKHIMARNESVYTAMNSLRAFLESTDTEFGVNHWCPLKDFQVAFKAFCGDNSTQQQQWTEEFCSGPFQEAKITIRKGQYIWGRTNNDKRLKGTLLVGVCPQGDTECMKMLPDQDNPVYEPLKQDDVDHFMITAQ